MHKSQKLLIGALAAVIALTGVYVGMSWHYQDRFLPNTEVLGINIAGKSPAQASKTLTAQLENKQFTFNEGNKTVFTALGKDLGVNADFTQALAKLKAKQNPWRWTESVFADSTTTNTKGPGLDQAQLNTYLTQEVSKLNQSRQAPVNASVKAVNGQYVVQKEINGTQIDVNKLTNATVAAMAADQPKIDLTTVYKQPTLRSTSATLKAQVEKLKALSTIKAQITIENHVVTIPTASIQSWVSYQNNQITWDTAAIQAYVANLAKQYGTYGHKLQFKSTKRGTVTVPAGTYGWSIAQASEVAQLTKDLSAGKDFNHEVAYQGSGYHKDGSVLGDLYIEVDKKHQHEWVYRNGKLVMDTDVVTGLPGQDTPSGVFYVWDKQRNAVLKGKNNDGTNYASPVSYWMPIDYTGVGLHDSPWQPKYGGTWYQSHGSHGCVNTPPSYMAKLFELIPTGTPVIVI